MSEYNFNDSPPYEFDTLNYGYDEEDSQRSKLFFYSVFITLTAYISRISELFPQLTDLRINMLLFVITMLLFFITGARKNITWKNNRELKLILLFLIVGCMSIPFSVWPGHAFKTCRDSLMVNTAIFLFCQAVIYEEKQLIGVFKIIIASCLLLLLGTFFKPIVVEGSRITTTMTYDPNDIALLFGFAFPIVISFFVSSKFIGKVFCIFLLLGLTFGIVKTGSRGGMLAFTVVTTLIFFSSAIKLKFYYKILIIVMIVMFITSPKGQNLRNRIGNTISGKDYNITSIKSAAGGRIAIWKSGLQLFVSKPLLGVGAGNSPIAMGLAHGDQSWKTMHNSYLQAAAEMGLGGFLVFLAILSASWANCRKAKQYLKEKDPECRSQIFSLAGAVNISLIGYMVAAFFLSQAFSVIIPLTLALSSRIRSLAVPPPPDPEPWGTGQEDFFYNRDNEVKKPHS